MFVEIDIFAKWSKPSYNFITSFYTVIKVQIEVQRKKRIQKKESFLKTHKTQKKSYDPNYFITPVLAFYVKFYFHVEKQCSEID